MLNLSDKTNLKRIQLDIVQDFLPFKTLPYL